MISSSCTRARYAWSALLVAMVFLLGRTVAIAETHYVWTNSPAPANPYTNWHTAAWDIHPAITSAAASDTVLVTNGLYTNSLNGLNNTSQVVITKALTLRSVNGAAVTIIDGNYPYVTNRCIHATVAGVTVDGVTVRNGRVANGANDGPGAGIYMPQGGAIRNCIVSGNRIDVGGNGAGISIAGGAGIDNCAIFNNTNSSSSLGGGFYIENTTVQNCRIYGNYCGFYGGGGAYLYGGTAIIKNCIIYSNTGAAGGGLMGWSGKIEGCLIFSNNAPTGAGVVLGNGTTYFKNCTIVKNSTGAGVHGFANANMIFVNVIIAQNSDCVSYGGGAQMGYFTNCSLQSIPSPTYSVTNDRCLFGVDNGFVNTNEYNYRLAPSSVCINAGFLESWMSTNVDLDAHTRVDKWSGLVDIGCYEYTPRGSFFKVR